MKLIYCKVSNFGCLTSITADFVEKGLVIVKGRNGAGKTTLFNSILWGLFGTSPKNGSQITTHGATSTRVELRLEVEGKTVEIARHLNYTGESFGRVLQKSNAILIRVDGKELAEQHKSDMQAFLSNLIGIDYQTFINTFFFAQRGAKLMSYTNSDKRQLFEKLFEFSGISELKAKLEEELKSLDDKILSSKTELSKAEYRVDSLEKQLLKANEYLDWLLNDKSVRVGELTKNVNENTQKIGKYSKLLELHKLNLSQMELPLQGLKESIASIDRVIAKEQSEYVSLTRREMGLGLEAVEKEIAENVKRLVELENGRCSLCLSNLSDTVLKNSINEVKNKLVELEDKMSGLVSKKHELESTMEDVREYIQELQIKKSTTQYKLKEAEDSYKEVQSLVVDTSSEISSLKLYLSRDKEELDKLIQEPKKDFDVPLIKADLELAKSEVLEHKKTYNALANEKEKLSWWKPAFNHNGIPSMVFNSMLNELNNLTTNYTNILGISVKFSLDLDAASKPLLAKCVVQGRECTYEDLSGGEKQRVDLAIMFAMQELVSSKAPINILVMDESFEGLDDEGMESVFEVLRVKAKTMGVYVISHRTNLDYSGADILEL